MTTESRVTKVSMCLGKIRFESEEIAQRVADKYTADSHKKGANNRLNGRTYGKGLFYRVYACPICHGYHHSTKPKGKQSK